MNYETRASTIKMQKMKKRGSIKDSSKINKDVFFIESCKATLVDCKNKDIEL